MIYFFESLAFCQKDYIHLYNKEHHTCYIIPYSLKEFDKSQSRFHPNLSNHITYVSNEYYSNCNNGLCWKPIILFQFVFLTKKNLINTLTNKLKL